MRYTFELTRLSVLIVHLAREGKREKILALQFRRYLFWSNKMSTWIPSLFTAKLNGNWDKFYFSLAKIIFAPSLQALRLQYKNSFFIRLWLWSCTLLKWKFNNSNRITLSELLSQPKNRYISSYSKKYFKMDIMKSFFCLNSQTHIYMNVE